MNSPFATLARSRFVLFLYRSLAFLAIAAALAGCNKGNQTPGPGAGAAPPPTPVTIVQMSPQRVPIVFDVVGQTEGSKQVEVRARVQGILEKRLYNEGEVVKAGAPLFQIERAPFEIALAQAKGQLSQTQAQVEQAQREETRLKPLAQERAISRKEYDDTVSSLQTTTASQQQATAQVNAAELNLSYTLINAPLSGITGRAEHSEGSLITTDAAGSLLTTINQINPIWVRFSLAQTDVAKLPSGHFNRANASNIELTLADGSKYPIKGRINFAASAIDLQLGTQQLRAEFDNPSQQVLPGQFVRIQITAGYRDNAFLVPQSAVLQTEKGSFVFVVDNESKAAIRPVTTGEWVGTNWSILSGLNAGDRVIVDNLLKVRPGAPVTQAQPQPAGSAAGAAPPASGSTAPAAPTK